MYVEGVIWDENNLEHIAYHSVRPAEVEQVLWTALSAQEKKVMAEIPKMTREEEAEFWKTHDVIDYDNSEPIEVEMGPRPRNHCMVCNDVLLSRYVNEVAGGRVVLRGLRELYCRQGHEVRLAPEAKRIVDAIEAVISLVPEFVRPVDSWKRQVIP
jgi:hypothetical protein